MTGAPLGIQVSEKANSYILAYQWSNATNHRKIFCSLFEYFEIVPGFEHESGQLIVKDADGNTQFYLAEGDVFILPDEDFSKAYVLSNEAYHEKFQSVQ